MEKLKKMKLTEADMGLMMDVDLAMLSPSALHEKLVAVFEGMGIKIRKQSRTDSLKAKWGNAKFIASGLQGIARNIYKEIQRDINPKKDTVRKIKDTALPYLKEYERELTFRDEEDVLDKGARIAKGGD
jgi:hypothetical protein